MVPSPRKRHTRFLLALPVVLAAFVYASSAKSETYGSTGDWFVDVNDGGSCVLSRYVGEQFYAIGAEWDAEGQRFYWTVLFFSPDIADLPAGESYPVNLVVEGAPWHQPGVAEIIRNSGVSYARLIISDHDFGTAFREGSTFAVRAARKEFLLPLDGSAEAQDIYVTCFLNSFVQPVAQNPFE